MTPQTITEKDRFISTFDREYETTLRLLRAYPADKLDLKPAEKSKTARDLAWMLVLNQMVMTPVLEGALDPNGFPKALQTMPEILAAFEKAHRDSKARLDRATDRELEGTIKIPTGPKKLDDIRVGDALWFFHSDSIHHRGQFSVYTRIAGAKVPSIYGPTADEPWF